MVKYIQFLEVRYFLENLNIFDVVTLLIVILLGLKGLFRGFIKEAFALLGIVGGVFVASRLAKDVGFFIDGFLKINNDSTILLAGFIISIVVFWGLSYTLGVLFSKIFSLSGLAIFDRTLGVIFGAGKIFFIFAIIFYSLSQVEAIKGKIESKVGNSTMYPLFVEIGGAIIKLDTSAIVKKIENFNSHDNTQQTDDSTHNDLVEQNKLEKKE